MRGPETKATPQAFPAQAEWFGIDFKLGTLLLSTISLSEKNSVPFSQGYAANSKGWECLLSRHSQPFDMKVLSHLWNAAA